MIQRTAVSFEYPVLFRRQVLDPANPSLSDAVAWREPERAHRVMFALDPGVVAARPAVLAELAGYAASRPRLQPAGTLIVPGGEACKNDPAQLARVHQAIFEHGLDRHS